MFPTLRSLSPPLRNQQSNTVRVSEEEVVMVDDDIFRSRELRMLDKFPLPRSHSTGHSLAENEEKVENNHDDDIVLHLPPAWSSKRVWYRSNNNVEQWSLSMTPLRVQQGALKPWHVPSI